MKFDYSKVSTRDFEDIPGLDIFDRADQFQGYLDYLDAYGHLNYLLKSTSGSGSSIKLAETNHINKDHTSVLYATITLASRSIQKLKKPLLKLLKNTGPEQVLLH